MEQNIDIDFYQDQDEEAFLDAWETKYGSLEEEELDDLYQKIANDIQSKYQEGSIALGDRYDYEGVLVGYCDYNAFNQLFLFSRKPL